MRNAIGLIAVTILLGCNKKQGVLPLEYQYLIGTWKNINGDEQKIIILHKNGRVEQQNEFKRSVNFKPKKCSYSEDKKMFFFDSARNAISFRLYTNANFDTIKRYEGFNQADSLVDQAIYYVKVN